MPRRKPYMGPFLGGPELADAMAEAMARAEAMTQVGRWQINPETGECLWSPRMYDILGLDPQVMSASPGLVKAPQRSIVEVTRDFIRALLKSDAEAAELDHHMPRGEGNDLIVRVCMRRVRDPLGATVFVVGTLLDVTKMRRAEALEEQALRLREQGDAQDRSLQSFQALSDYVPHMLWSCNAQGELDYCNQRFVDYTGQSYADLQTWGWLRVLHPDDLARTKNQWMKCVHTGTAYAVDYRLRQADGQYRWHAARALPVRDQAGKVYKWFGTCTDSHEAKLADEAARQAEARLRGVLESTPVIMWATDRDGIITLAEGQLIGAADEQRRVSVGRSIFDVAQDPERVAQALKRVLNGEKFVVEQQRAGRTLAMHYAPVQSAAGTIDGMVAICVDVTDRSEAERLTQSEKHARELAHLKSEFLARMSHEIRTPLNGVLGTVELLLDTNLSPQQRRLAEISEASGKQLLNIINDILDLDQLEKGTFHLKNADVDICALVEDEVYLVVSQAHEKRIAMKMFIDPDLPRFIQGDAERIGQVLLNLLSNAVKFTTQGSIVVRVCQAAGVAGEPKVRISVTDTGTGVAQSFRQRLFAPFNQAEVYTSRRYGGAGLGLSIAKRLVETMGGTIGVESQEGSGSTFWFTLPLVTPSAPEQTVAPPNIGQALVISADRTEQAFLQLYLEHMGVTVEFATEVGEAMATITTPGPLYDLVLCDAELTGADLLTLPQSLPLQPRTASARLVLLGPSHETIDTTAAGFTQVLHKPLRRQAIESLIRGAIAIPHHASESDHAHTPGHRLEHHHRLLVAEDNAINQVVINNMLTKLGYQVKVVPNGVEALQALDEDVFDLVLMDCQMPEMDGYEATRLLRRREKDSGVHVPVLALTASAMVEDKLRCSEAGMDDFLSKPVSGATLAEALGRWLT